MHAAKGPSFGPIITQSLAPQGIEALFEELQLLSHLSATRGNGLRAMIQRIQQIAAAAI